MKIRLYSRGSFESSRRLASTSFPGFSPTRSPGLRTISNTPAFQGLQARRTGLDLLQPDPLQVLKSEGSELQ